MKRNLLSHLLAVCTALGATIASSPTARSEVSNSRPNIVFIVADDLGYADLSSYGRKDYQTPNLDRLASEGVRFSQAYAGAPVCTPSRVSFMTGRYPARAAVGLQEPLTGGPQDRAIGLSTEHPTISSLLKKGGYLTALIGKWHLGSQPEHHPSRHGFDEFFGMIQGATDYISHVSPLGQPDLFHNQDLVKREGYLTDLLTEQAVAFISRSIDRPFFLSVQYTAPHWPWQRPGDLPYPPSSEPDAAASWTKGGSPEIYAAMIKRLDDGIGAILAALDKAGLRENTLVVFTSDNGGEKYSQMEPFAGKKMQLWEGGIRVPAMMRWPRVLTADKKNDQVAITMDWTATILAAAQVQLDPGSPLDGINLLPVCRGDAPIQSRTIAWRTFQRTRHKALRHGDWKYLHDGKSEHLFNVVRDPGEKHNLKSENPERLEELKNLFRDWEAQMLEPVPVAAPQQTSDTHTKA
jgi:arylsulfatase A-like enzyme